MDSFNIDVNDRIEVIENDKSYKSLIVDIDKDYIKINIPVYDGEYLMLDIGKVLIINRYSNNGKCYSFNAEVLSKEKEGNIPCYKLSEATNIKRIQRRSYFRVKILNNAHYKNITNIDENNIDNKSYVEAIILDLSGSGVKLKINEDIHVNDILSIKMMIKGSELIVNGEVVRTEISEDRKKICGVKFLDISQAQTDKIIEELFEIMRKQRALM